VRSLRDGPKLGWRQLKENPQCQLWRVFRLVFLTLPFPVPQQRLSPHIIIQRDMSIPRPGGSLSSHHYMSPEASDGMVTNTGRLWDGRLCKYNHVVDVAQIMKHNGGVVNS
jgi:hypothetical protein